MKMTSFRTLIREEIKKALNEDAAAASRYADLLKQRVQIEKEIQQTVKQLKKSVKIDSKGAKFVLTTAGGKQYLVNRKASDNGQRVLTDLQGKNISPNGGIFKGSVEDAAAYVATLD